MAKTATKSPTHLAAKLRLEGGLSIALNRDSLSNLGTGGRGDKLHDFVVVAWV
jgi:hypothetical protein